MPTFLCLLNWTDQGAKNAKDAKKRFQASKNVAEKLGGPRLCVVTRLMSSASLLPKPRSTSQRIPESFLLRADEVIE
jgi:hypothetical protein